ncbi:MAG TPA: hypothetical protein VJ860_04885 [Polyangia bacterium]|jgi:hypothetical protein|nr:hypothetical protein [Polyangia bacterium]
MRSLRSDITFSVLVLAAGLGLSACSTQKGTALLVDVTLDNLVTPRPDKITFVVSRQSRTFASQHVAWPATSVGPIEVALRLPAEAAGTVNVDVQAWFNGGPIAAASPSPSTTIVADKVNGPFAVTLTPIGGSVDGGTDALPSDGPHPDLAAGSEVGLPDAGVTPDAHSDGPEPDAAAPDARPPADVVQPTDTAQLADAAQPADVVQPADVSHPADVVQPADVAHPADVAQLPDALPPIDAAEAGVDAPALPDKAPLTDAVEAGADSSVGPGWQPGENAQYDPNDPISSGGYPGSIAVAVDPVKEHVYVMWADNRAPAVRVRRWDHATGTWNPTQTLDNRGICYPSDVQIGVDSQGRVIAAWRCDDQTDGVLVSRSTDGTSWLAKESVTPKGSWSAKELSMAVARNGQARIAFSEMPTASPSTVQLYSSYFDGTTWTTGSDPLAPEASGDTSFHYARVAIGDDGSGIILFKHKDPNDCDSVAASTFAGGSATVNNFVILDSNTTDNLSEYAMAVAVNRSGQGAVVWADTNGVLLRSYSPTNSTWTPAQNLGDMGLSWPSMVMAPDATITLAWQQEDSGYFNVWAIEGTVGGTWTKAAPLETDNLAIQTGGYWGYYETLPFPALAVDGDGNVLALWCKKTKNTPVEFAVYSRRKLAGKPNGVWQPATKLASASQYQPYRTSLAVSDHGLGAAAYYWSDPNADPNTPFNADAYQVFVSFFR